MKLLICGAGAIGSHVLHLARNLQVDLASIDFDRVETKNLASQWFVKPMVGKYKATAAKMQLWNFYGLKAKDYSVRLTEANADLVLSSHDFVVDCFDNGDSRRLLQTFVRDLNLPCLHAGLAADGTFGSVRWDDHFVPDNEDRPGQATCENGEHLPLILNVSAAVVSSIQHYLHSGEERHWNLSPGQSEAFS